MFCLTLRSSQACLGRNFICYLPSRGHPDFEGIFDGAVYFADSQLDGEQEGRRLLQLATSQKWGMCMAACLMQPPAASPKIHLLAGYEDGTVAVWDTGIDGHCSNQGHAPCEPVMHLKAHGEPIMSLHADTAGTGASPTGSWTDASFAGGAI